MNFISRLLEEEGIFYYFDHDGSGHKMVFRDKSETLAACPKQATASYSFSDEGWLRDDDGVRTLDRVEQVHTSQVSLQDYSFEKPSFDLSVSLKGPGKEEVYDYPGKYTEKSDGDAYARLRLEERETEAFLVRGTGRCRAFRPGYRFTLKDHFRADTNQDYVLTSVTHEALDSTYRSSDLKPHEYSNSFLAIPKSVPFRPARRSAKPVVRGSQTALVTGKTGEEIWVDNYGRIKVQFPWDREGKKDEKSSCWIRVAQIWAGKNWGWVTLPRVGQEVIVDFIEGDPDRPIVTGRVYNADQMPPYTLPGNQTQSGIKTRSTKNGSTENYNEIQFEDLKGSEKITVHAEKDMDTTVEHDDSQTVQNNRTITVSGTHTETITKSTTIKITEGNHSLTIDQGNQSVTLDQGNQTIKLSMGNQSTTLSLGNQSTKVELGKIESEAMQSIELKVGGSSIKIDQMGVTIKGMMIQIEGDLMTQVKGDAMLTLKGGITMIN